MLVAARGLRLVVLVLKSGASIGDKREVGSSRRWRGDTKEEAEEERLSSSREETFRSETEDTEEAVRGRRNASVLGTGAIASRTRVVHYAESCRPKPQPRPVEVVPNSSSRGTSQECVRLTGCRLGV